LAASFNCQRAGAPSPPPSRRLPQGKETAPAWGGLRPHGRHCLKCAGSNRHDFGSRQTAPSLQGGKGRGRWRRDAITWMDHIPATAHANARSLASRLRNTDNSQTFKRGVTAAQSDGEALSFHRAGAPSPTTIPPLRLRRADRMAACSRSQSYLCQDSPGSRRRLSRCARDIRRARRRPFHGDL